MSPLLPLPADATALMIALGAGLTVMLVVAGLATVRSSLRVRTGRRLAAIAAVESVYQAPASGLKDHRVSGIRAVDGLFRGKGWVAETQRMLQHAAVPLLVGEYLAVRGLSVLAGGALGLASAIRFDSVGLTSAALVSAGMLAGLLLPPFLIRRRARRREAEVETQLVELCDVMSSMLRSGYGYVQALTATAAEVGPPLSVELQQLLDTVRLGGDVDAALDELNQRLGSRDFDIVASAISIQRKSGGNLGEILAGVAETIRQRQSFQREVRALTAKERFTAVLVAAFPLGLTVLLMWMSPDPYTRLVTDVLGRVVLGIALVLDAAGFFIIRKLSQVEY